ncbi:ORF6N domain-containing protein [Morganella morganii]|uniref:ORF6N domain-containing protein n=1 Tax=Morganella morganii TaxID=582 RepID=UPI002368B287|nr:ORF6N domain-containing protein [Morganella morganii]
MTTQISVESLSPIAFKNIPVVTTELLANLYGTESENVKKNYGRNAGRFVEGKHYFKLEGDELREFKYKVTNCPFVKIAPNVRHLMLWTERGAARHAKMLETDQAWEVFEKLEDSYFSQRTEVAQADMFVSEPNPLNVTIPNEGRWLVVYRNGTHKVVNVDGHNVVEVDFINKLQRDTNLLMQLMRDYHIRTQVLKGDKSGDILNVPLITK